MMFPDYASKWYYSMPFVKALRWYGGGRPCQIITGNFYIAHIFGIRQAELDAILSEIQVIEGFLHIHAVDLNINLPKLQTIYAKELTGPGPSNKTSAVFVDDFKGTFIRMPELRDVGQGNFAVRAAPNLCGWNPDFDQGFFPGHFTQKTAKHFTQRVVKLDEDTDKYAMSFSNSSCKRPQGCPAGCSYCFDEETCQQPTKIGCEACGPDEFCDTNDFGGVFCCKEGNRCLGSCSDFAKAFCINAGWKTNVSSCTVKGGTVSAMTCNACADGTYELWMDPPLGKHCVPCVDTKSKKRPHGSARHGPICMAKTEYPSKCHGGSLYEESTNSCHYKCPYGTSQGGWSSNDRNSFVDISHRDLYSACHRCGTKYNTSENNLAPSCMHECRLFHDLSLFNIRNLYPFAEEFRLEHFNPYNYEDYATTEDGMRDCHILAGDLNITHLTSDSPYPGTRVPPDFLQVISRITIVKGTLTITDTDLLLVPFLRMLTRVQHSAIIRRNAHLVSIDLSRFGDQDICRMSLNRTQCRLESRISDNGKWINPTGKSNTKDGVCGDNKCEKVEGLQMDAKNVRYTAGDYISTRGDCTSTTFASGLCRNNNCPRGNLYSVLVRNHQVYWACTIPSDCNSKWVSKLDNPKVCRPCSEECTADPKNRNDPVRCRDGPLQCLYECKSGMKIKLNNKEFCTASEKCPPSYYVHRGEKKECKLCNPVCLECDGPGEHFGKGGCTKCAAVYLKKDDNGKYRESCVQPSPRPSCILGDTCQARDFNPAYEISKDLPPYIGDD
ncbi:hypothetical protein AAVH_07969 [Aphelenchoides avenae]|nr:hypothetical protein AAVH_07969 [Aphelenchus avenae]